MRRKNNERMHDMRWVLRLFLLAPLAACAIPHPPPPPDDHKMSDALLIMTTARLNASLRDVTPPAPSNGTSTSADDVRAAAAAASTGLNVLTPAYGVSSLAGGLLSGLNLLSARQITAPEVP
jgi:hypothetical protein